VHAPQVRVISSALLRKSLIIYRELQ